MESNRDILKAPQNPPLAIEPADKEWGVGISGLTEEPSPFPRVNKLLRWLKDTDSTCDSKRALIVTECFEKYAAYPQNVKWAMTLREVLSRYDIKIWPDELLVGELVAPPNGAPVYPEFSIDWLVAEFEQRPMEDRKNDRYVISEQVKRDICEIAPKWKGKTVSEAGIDRKSVV
jgi:formate C-acetyltransferase